MKKAATGNIIDPLTGRKMAVSEAAQLGYIDKVYEQCLLRAERAVHGYKTRYENVLNNFKRTFRNNILKKKCLTIFQKYS